MNGFPFPRHHHQDEEDEEEEDRRRKGLIQSRIKSSNFKPNCISEFQLLKQIGQGASGKVWVARSRIMIDGDDDDDDEGLEKVKSEKVIAIKAIRKSTDNPNFDPLKVITTEINSLKRLDRSFPFIAHLRAEFSNENFSFLVLDYASGGDLYEFLDQNGPLDESCCQLYVAELGCALEELRSNKIIFRDLKSENVLICRDGHLKLTDFGLSKVLLPCSNSNGQGYGRSRAQSVCGTPHSISPEMIRKECYDFKSDWWGLGTIMYEMLTGISLFNSHNGEGGSSEILNCFERILYKRLTYPKKFSRDCKEVLNRLLERDHNRRLNNLEDLINLNWFDKKFKNVQALRKKKINPPNFILNHLMMVDDDYRELLKTPIDFYHPETDSYNDNGSNSDLSSPISCNNSIGSSD